MVEENRSTQRQEKEKEMATAHHDETNFTTASSIMMPMNRFYFDSEIEPFLKTRQDYSPYRSAQTHQQEDSTAKQAFVFIGKTRSFLLKEHPARFYSQPRPKMNEKSDTQKYSRYRDATYHAYYQVNRPDQSVVISPHSQLTEKHRHQNEYSRYRSSEVITFYSPIYFVMLIIISSSLPERNQHQPQHMER